MPKEVSPNYLHNYGQFQLRERSVQVRKILLVRNVLTGFLEVTQDPTYFYIHDIMLVKIP